MRVFTVLVFERDFCKVLSPFILPFFSSPKRGIQDVHVESNQGTHTLHLVSGAFDFKKFKALFTPYWIAFNHTGYGFCTHVKMMILARSL